MNQEVTCPQCGQKLRLTIRKESLGGKIQVSCTNCKNKFVVMARESREKKLETLVKTLSGALQAAITTDSKIQEIFQEIKTEGYDVVIFLDGTILLEEKNGTAEACEHAPLVHDGEVAEDAFTKTDEAFMKNLRIKLL